MCISDKTVAVVTGAGSGIGKAIASEHAKRGCHLALVDIDRSALYETVAELSNSVADGGEFLGHPCSAANSFFLI